MRAYKFKFDIDLKELSETTTYRKRLTKDEAKIQIDYRVHGGFFIGKYCWIS